MIDAGADSPCCPDRPSTLTLNTEHAHVTLHVDNLRGANAHHQAETVFKAFGRALRMAVELDPRIGGVPSTKGTL